MKKKWSNVISTILFLIFLGIFVFSAWKLWGIYREYQNGIEAYEEITEQFVKQDPVREKEKTADTDTNTMADVDTEEPLFPVVDFQALRTAYPDVKAWIYCKGTPINYPITWREDNEYYLHRLLNGEYDKGGTLFADCRNQPDFSDWNTIVYGHNMKNDTMFGVLPDYMEQEFYEKHPVMYLLTEEQNYEIRLIGGYVTPADAEIYQLLKSEAERDALIRAVSRASSFDADVSVGAEEKLITLSTCVYDYEDARYVLVGALKKLP